MKDGRPPLALNGFVNQHGVRVLEFLRSKHGHSIWKCECPCGDVFEAVGSTIKSGKRKSCGMSSCWRGGSLKKHGHASGKRCSAEYWSWNHMIMRCTNPKNNRYHRYGARGISVCDAWKKFENFIADMGLKPSPELSLDRIDNDGNYCKENCRWATREQQIQTRTYPKRRRRNIFQALMP